MAAWKRTLAEWLIIGLTVIGVEVFTPHDVPTPAVFVIGAGMGLMNGFSRMRAIRDAKGDDADAN